MPCVVLRLPQQVPFSSHQLGGDAWLYRNLFYGKRKGFFVEVGAGGGGGASRWLAAAAGWRGMLIEGDQGAPLAPTGLARYCA